MLFRHYSPVAGLVSVDPRYFGSNKAGRERFRASVKSICLYASSGPIESDLFHDCYLYTLEIPTESLYDLSADSLNLLGDDFGLTERRIKRRGFIGYWLPTGSGIFKGQERLFKRWPCKAWSEEAREVAA